MSIFNKRNREEVPLGLRPTAAPPSNPIEPKKEATPVSSMNFSTPEPDRTCSQAVIGKAVKIKGQIRSKEDLYVDGYVEGTIELQDHRLTIGPNGIVHSDVKAREVVIVGSVQGNVDASDKIQIRKDATVVGDIKTPRIMIDDGAYVKGSIDTMTPEPVTSGVTLQPRPQLVLVAAAAATSSQRATAAGD